MLPQVISHKLVHLFKYWHNGIQQGMRHGNHLYTYVRSYPLHERLQAYDLSGDLANRGIPTCITCSEQQYTIWISLQAAQLVDTTAIGLEQASLSGCR
jgi:hypothetical protein